MFWKKNARIKKRRFSSFVLGLVCFDFKKRKWSLVVSRSPFHFYRTKKCFWILKRPWDIVRDNPRSKPRDRVHHVAKVWVSYGIDILSAFISLPSGDLKNQHALVSFWHIFSPKWTLSWSVNKKHGLLLFFEIMRVQRIYAMQIFVLAVYTCNSD